ncbi:MAG: hypothetical protein HKO92_04835 [Flavobacteriaceae bacterium]|jgi:FtsH-binding integral membrane protein|nr:hypothetical protein [Flavobacteriaceae bacterium]
MKTKNFLISGIVGGIVNFLLGWLFYGLLFVDSFPQPEESSNTLIMIFLGCLTFGLFLAYIFTHWAQITTASTGAKAGAIIGIFMGFYFNFFNMAMNTEATYQLFALDLGISIIMTAITGAIIALINGKLK